MASNEVKELRKSGKLEEALKVAKIDLEKEPNNIWCKRGISWVYYDLLKANAKPLNLNSFTENLSKIKELDLGEDENMLYDNCAWQIGSVLFSLQGAQQVDFPKINEIFETIKGFHFTKPSEGYSFLLKAFHKGHQNWSNYLDLIDWWDLKSFSESDFQQQEFDGRKSMSLAETVYIAISKKLLSSSPFPSIEINNDEKINEFMPQLDKLIETHPEFQYPLYYKVKLMLKTGNKDNVLSAFLPFAKRKKNDYWVWELMADIFHGDADTQFACICKALSFKGQEEFKINIRQKFAKMLIQKEMFSEAKTEINQIKKIRTDNGWNLPSTLNEWINSEWYKENNEKETNLSLYRKYSEIADEILLQDLPEELIIVEFVNKEKNILNFVKNKTKSGFFSYKGLIRTPNIGDILKVRFDGKGDNSFHRVLTLDKMENDTPHEALQILKGTFRKGEDQNFGFLENVFIDPPSVERAQLKNGDNTTVKAILSFNKKKNEWGWKAIDAYKN